MTIHLSDEQFSAALLLEDDASAGQHLASCEECRLELERVRTVLIGARAESLVLADRPQLFWSEQRMAIASRIPDGREISTRPLAWAASFVILALAAAWMTYTAPPVQRHAGPAQNSSGVSASIDPDHALLLDIQRSVRRDVPRALEPATLLAEELHRAANGKSDR